MGIQREAAPWLLDGGNCWLSTSHFFLSLTPLLFPEELASGGSCRLSSLSPYMSPLFSLSSLFLSQPRPRLFFYLLLLLLLLKQNSSLLLLAALALAAARSAAAVSPSFAGLSAAEEKAVRENEADYSHFAELVATVMIVRGEDKNGGGEGVRARARARERERERERERVNATKGKDGERKEGERGKNANMVKELLDRSAPTRSRLRPAPEPFSTPSPSPLSWGEKTEHPAPRPPPQMNK